MKNSTIKNLDLSQISLSMIHPIQATNGFKSISIKAIFSINHKKITKRI